MPIYEYQCQECGDITELLQRFDDPAPEACDECGGEIRKLVSAPAFQFKGSGWYVTDYARKGQQDSSNGKSAGKTDEAAGESKASGETEKTKDSGSEKTTSKASSKTAAASA